MRRAYLRPNVPELQVRNLEVNDIHNVTMTKYFDADRPIEHRDQDRLRRRPFSEAIAQHIRTIPAGSGFTVALSGEWGSGKTSILNMVAETLEEESETIAVLRFNPWLFGGTSDLMTRFFQELSAQLGQSHSEKVKTVAKALSTLGQSLAPLSPVPGTTVVANIIAGQAEQWAQPKSLLAERKHLENLLADSDTRVVVLIDDIDRLEPRETRELMRLVRLPTISLQRSSPLSGCFTSSRSGRPLNLRKSFLSTLRP